MWDWMFELSALILVSNCGFMEKKAFLYPGLSKMKPSVHDEGCALLALISSFKGATGQIAHCFDLLQFLCGSLFFFFFLHLRSS